MCIVFGCVQFVKFFDYHYNQSGLLKIEILILLRLARFKNLKTPPSNTNSMYYVDRRCKQDNLSSRASKGIVHTMNDDVSSELDQRAGSRWADIVDQVALACVKLLSLRGLLLSCWNMVSPLKM